MRFEPGTSRPRLERSAVAPHWFDDADTWYNASKFCAVHVRKIILEKWWNLQRLFESVFHGAEVHGMFDDFFILRKLFAVDSFQERPRFIMVLHLRHHRPETMMQNFFQIAEFSDFLVINSIYTVKRNEFSNLNEKNLKFFRRYMGLNVLNIFNQTIEGHKNLFKKSQAHFDQISGWRDRKSQDQRLSDWAD